MRIRAVDATTRENSSDETLEDAVSQHGHGVDGIQLPASAVVAGRMPRSAIRAVDATPSTSSRPDPLAAIRWRSARRSARNDSAATAPSGAEWSMPRSVSAAITAPAPS
ncbi:hypothetical protein [Microbacterium suwonense]|uniref:hypothetical protein n=1 Tax=Microbacterium suwonense TaxID=683047 RepID=UPI002573B465|nr:hypothetical protein [Microbacterium suwonense]